MYLNRIRMKEMSSDNFSYVSRSVYLSRSGSTREILGSLISRGWVFHGFCIVTAVTNIIVSVFMFTFVTVPSEVIYYQLQILFYCFVIVTVPWEVNTNCNIYYPSISGIFHT